MRSSDHLRDYHEYGAQYRADSLAVHTYVAGLRLAELPIHELKFELALLAQDTVALFLRETNVSFDLIVLVSWSPPKATELDIAGYFSCILNPYYKLTALQSVKFLMLCV